MAKKDYVRKYSFVEMLSRTTVKNVTYQTKKTPANYHEENPDPKATFKGADGKWYKISSEFPIEGINCYAFAMGWTLPGDYMHTNIYIPGFSQKVIPEKMEEIVPLIEADLNKIGRKVHKIYLKDFPTKLPEAPAGTYYIKVMCSDEEDVQTLHMARKDANSGRWLHKMGWSAAPMAFMRNLKIFGLDEAMNLVASQNTGMSERDLDIQRAIFESNPFLRARISNELGVISSIYEENDDASYFSFNPERSLTQMQEYKVYAIMLIDF